MCEAYSSSSTATILSGGASPNLPRLLRRYRTMSLSDMTGTALLQTGCGCTTTPPPGDERARPVARLAPDLVAMAAHHTDVRRGRVPCGLAADPRGGGLPGAATPSG